MKRRRARLVIQHLEGIAGAALDEYPEVLKEFIRGRNGVYALYKKERLYYVGLARNLRSRLRHHLRDRHAGRWDRFSIYLTENDEHLKELESLVLRIAEPHGNKVTGKFLDSEDLKRTFRRRLRERLDQKVNDMTEWAASESSDEPTPVRTRSKSEAKGEATLAKYVSTRFHIRYRYKGKQYIAHVNHQGKISFAPQSAEYKRLRGIKHNSPSMAAKAITGRAMNGWTEWRFWSTKGDLVPLDALRKGTAKPRF
jgi:hypothetical protein